ncbi:MAG: hypothetical protein FJX76_14905 [Armatimonadetes bacterium]|nr:hypothetical protein [Armatimonadota bacterium]
MMTEKAENDVEEGRSESRDIRFLREKRKKSGAGVYVMAALLLIAGLAYALWYREAFTPPPTEAAAPSPLLVDRLWIDEMPQRDTDKFNFYVFSSEDNFGVNDKAQSIYKHVVELFYYDAKDTALRFQFPHDRRDVRTACKVEKMARPKDEFDLQLTINADPQNSGKTTVYYSSTKWSSHDKTTMPEILRNLPMEKPVGF